MGRTVPFRNQDDVVRFRAQRLGAVQRPAPADQPEPGAVLAARHHLRRRRAGRTSRCPTLRGRVPIHVGSGHTLGERGGEQAHTLSIAELPTHTHVAAGRDHDAGDAPQSGGNLLARRARTSSTSARPNLMAMSAGIVANVGGSQAHLNMQPFLTLSFCIALQGIFPSPN